MAKFTRVRLDEANVAKVLGEKWRPTTRWARPTAIPLPCDLPNSGNSYRTDLYVADGDGCVPVQGASSVVVPVKELSMWPKDWDVEIDLANLYMDENGNYLHPLKGLRITELVKETHYPFHNEGYVNVILAYRDDEGVLSINHPRPNVAIFVDTWSPYDERMQTAGSGNPFSIFDVPNHPGLIRVEQFQSSTQPIGKNYIMVPFGFDFDSPDDVAALNSLLEDNANQWEMIIQEFLDGEDDQSKAEENMENDADKPGDVLSTVDNTAVAAVEVDDFANFQKDLADEYRGQFLTMKNINKALACEAYLGEASDKNGVLLSTFATEITGEENALCSYKLVKGVCYLVRRYNYSRIHLKKLESDLDTLAAEFEALS